MRHFRAFLFALCDCSGAGLNLILIACDLCRRQISCNLLMLLVKHCDFLRIINILHLNITFGSKNTSHSVRNFTGTTLQGSHAVAFKYHSNRIQHIHTFTENSSCLYILQLIPKNHACEINGINTNIQKRTACQLRLTDTFHLTDGIVQIGSNSCHFTDHTA